MIKDYELLEKYNGTWEKLKIELDSEPVYNEKYLIAKIKRVSGTIYFFLLRPMKKSFWIFCFMHFLEIKKKFKM